MPDPPARPDVQARLAWAIDGLRESRPDESAHSVVTKRQRTVALIGVAVLIVLGLVAWELVLGVVVAFTLLLYVATIVQRLVLIRHSRRGESTVQISDEEARAVPDHELPRYTVMVPAYREPEVVATLIASLDRLEYPRDRLEVLLVLEADDDETLEAARLAIGDGDVHIVQVPPAEPRTKPKALNFALLEATGDLVTIYDAEDVPEPLQLRKAALALARADHRVACVQAQLNYFNPEQNLITQWFTIEYTTWFTQFLPGLMATGAPIPLGGTSNHFRRNVLIEAGGWDPYNVTEDADLGVRLHRLGFAVQVLESITLEEANSDFVNWVKQRSRWYKGYLQTWLLNLRHPVRSARELGLRNFLTFNLFVGGTPLLALVNPIFWGMGLLWFIMKPAVIADIFTGPVYYVGLLCWVVGNFLLFYSFLLTAVARDDVKLLKAALLIPAYFVMMSLAAYKAAVQLVFNASYWEKTTHGLSRQRVVEPGAAA